MKIRNRFIVGTYACVDINDVSAFIFTIIQGTNGIVCKMKNCVEISLIDDFVCRDASRKWLLTQFGDIDDGGDLENQ